MRDNILITGKSGFIGQWISGGREFTGRLEDYGSILDQMKGITGIVHLAAKSNRTACEEDIEGCLLSNVIGSYNIIKAACVSKVWLLFISTFQVRERNIYGLSKLMGEEFCRMFVKKGLKVRILRLPIVYGPGDRSYKVVTKIIDFLKAGKNPEINTDKDFYFVYVADVVKIIESEVSMLDEGFGKPYSLRSLTEGIKACL